VAPITITFLALIETVHQRQQQRDDPGLRILHICRAFWCRFRHLQPRGWR